MRFPQIWPQLGLGLCGVITLALLSLGRGLADDDVKSYQYQTLVLTDNRICKACRVEPVDAEHVQLIDPAGNRITICTKEILGVDRHPFWRKTLSYMAHGVGLPGMLIVPGAFQNAKEYVCKYCDAQ